MLLAVLGAGGGVGCSYRGEDGEAEKVKHEISGMA